MTDKRESEDKGFFSEFDKSKHILPKDCIFAIFDTELVSFQTLIDAYRNRAKTKAEVLYEIEEALLAIFKERAFVYEADIRREIERLKLK